jgi:hypothetical protein
MDTAALYESTAMFLLLLTSVICVYLAASLVHASRDDRLGTHAAPAVAAPVAARRCAVAWGAEMGRPMAASSRRSAG